MTDNNKVWRIVVMDKWVTDEANIKIRFNNLCRQFAKNEKYFPLNENPEILESEMIGYEMLVNKRRYESAYFQSPVKLSELSEEENNKILSEMGFDKDTVDGLSDSEKKEFDNTFVDYMTEKYWSKKMVWFIINDEGLKYRIVIFYDNEYNHADGEDL